MKRILLLFSALMLLCIALWAHDVDIDGIYYNLDETNKTAAVTYRGVSSSEYSNEYSGSVTIPEAITYNSKTYSVTSIGYQAFFGCSGLTSVTIPNSVTSIGSSAFNKCSGLTSVSIPNSVTSIEEDTFSGCSGLTSITIPNSVTSIGYTAFFGCSGLKKVNYLGTVDKWVDIDFEGYLSYPTYYAKDLYINNELLTDIKITTADSIKKYAFFYCQSIKSVEIGESVTSISSSAFYNTGIYNNNSKWDNGVLYIDNCLIAANSDVVIGSYTIKEGTRVISGAAFEDCSELTSVTIPNSVTSIGEGAFSGCSGLTSVTIPNSVTSIGDWTFINCSGLTSVSIPNSVTSIGDWSFNGCSELTEVTIPNSVTSIGEYAFYGCSELTEVSIGESVTSIGEYAFYDCDNLKKVTAYPTTVPNVYESSFADYNAALYVPCDVSGDYSSDDVFGTFDVIECIAAEEVDGPGEEDVPTSITETLADANITVSGGTISTEADFSIYNTIGQDVTAFNGSLQPGVYLVSIENNIVKVMVK